jgi:hypothetical protein
MSILRGLPGPHKNFVKKLPAGLVDECRSLSDVAKYFQAVLRYLSPSTIPYAYLGEVLRLASRRRKPALAAVR